ncbi:MAG: hypothetical protein KC615_12150 [Anaerolineae bacterium]|nr:hypothetical protein [Anaerolineae bacterium]
MSTPALRWKAGTGWLVFSGGNTISSPIRAEVLSRAKAAGHVAYISFADDDGDELIDDMEDLGAPSGFLVDLNDPNTAQLTDDLRRASVIVIESGIDLDPMMNGVPQAAIDGFEEALNSGCIILVEGVGINLFGRWIMTDGGDLVDGLDWVENGFIEPGNEEGQSSYAIQSVLGQFPQAIAIAINPGSALALGYDNQVQVWGKKQVTITLGSNYQ